MGTARNPLDLARRSVHRLVRNLKTHGVLVTVKKLLGLAKGSVHRFLSSLKTHDTFCAAPFNLLDIKPDGHVSICCSAVGGLSAEDGSPLSVYTHSLDEIWNSEDMRSIRRDMLKGKQITSCACCYRDERLGKSSLRQQLNAAWQDGSLSMEQPLTIDALKLKAAANDYRSPTMPSSLHLEVGNQCNLKCRMCSGSYSSRIERDPVHGQWSPGAELESEAGQTRFASGEHWFKQKDFIRNELIRHPEQLRYIYLHGGEPLLIKEVSDLLQHLVDVGAAHHIQVSLVSNATVTKSPVLRLADKFRLFKIGVSLDGFGKYYEYIRYPAKWENVTRNIEILRGLPKIKVRVTVTFQAYNALNITDLFRYLDSAGLAHRVHMVTWPQLLQATVLPPRARRLAAERLRSYAERECLSGNGPFLLGLARMLDAAGDSFDMKLMRSFMLFTNDLDVSRGQSFRETHGELLELISEAGFEWTMDTLHANRNSPKGRVALPLTPDS